MNSGDAFLFGVVAALATNHVLLRIPGWERRRALFYGVQLLNLTAGTWVMAMGIPGLDGPLKVFNWVFGLLFIARTVQNNNRYAKALRARRRAQGAATDARKDEIRAALRRGETTAGASAPEPAEGEPPEG